MVRRTNDDEIRRHLGGLFQRAVEALGEVRDAVVRSSQLGKLKLDASFLRRERDAVLLRLGEAIYDRVLRRAMDLPEELNGLLRELRALDERLEAHHLEMMAVEEEARAEREAAREAERRAREIEETLAPEKYERWPERGEEAEPAAASGDLSAGAEPEPQPEERVAARAGGAVAEGEAASEPAADRDAEPPAKKMAG